MKKTKSNRKYLTAFVLLFVMITVMCIPGAKAEETLENINFSAGMYSDANRTNMQAELTADGSTMEGWEYIKSSDISADKYLGINVSNLPLDGSQYQIVIEMEPYIYINTNADPVIDKTTLTYKKNPPLTVNTNGQYPVKTYSLETLTYTIDPQVTGLSFGLPLQFDVNLWNKQEGAEIGRGTDPLIKVYLKKIKDGEEVVISDSTKILQQATVEGYEIYSTRYSMHLATAGSSQNETSNMGANDLLRFTVNSYSDTDFRGGNLIKKNEIKIQMPYCTDADGKKHFVEYSNFEFSTTTGTPEYEESYDEETGILTIRAENIYYNKYTMFNIFFSAPEELKTIPGNYVLKGSVTTKLDGKVVNNNQSFIIYLDTNTNAIIKSFTNTGKANIIDLDTVQPFGTLAIRNDAATGNGSGKMMICLDFDSNKTKTVAVTTVNIMCDRDTKNIDVYYSLVDREGNPAYPDPETGENQVFHTTLTNKHYSPGAAISTSHYITYYNKILPVEEHQQYYFDTFSYTMGHLPGNTKAYHSGASLAPYSAGTIWGNVTTSTVPTTNPRHTMKVYAMNSEGELLDEIVSATVTTSIGKGTSVPYGIESGSTSTSTVAPGGTATIKGKVFVPNYPYTSNNCLNDITLGMILPEGVTINTSDITATYTGGTLPVKSITTRQLANQQVLHIIEFEQGKKIGYYNEKLSSLPNGSALNVTVKVHSEKVMATQTISLRDSVFIAGYLRENGMSGSYNDHVVVDKYDLNQNGSTTDKIGMFGTETTSTITFEANTDALVITDTIIVNEVSGKEQSISTFADTLEYKLDIECAKTGTATDFYYIIPICKTDMIKESDFVNKCENDLELRGPATTVNYAGAGMTVLYAFDSAKSYSAASQITDWYESLPEGKDWSDVTFIKVIANENVIGSGSHNVINVPLGYSGEDLDYMNKDGLQIGWSSKGYYSYVLGSNSNSGVQSTKGTTLTLEYDQQPVYITLTAAKGGEPKEAGAVASSSFTIPEIDGDRTYTLKQITTSNMSLVDIGYDFSSVDSTQANENFRILANVKTSSGTQESQKIAVTPDSVSIGSITGDTSAEITFKIENADIITEVVTDRKTSMVLVGTDGTLIPVYITVNRELTPADPTKSAITTGKVYMPFEGPNAVTLSNNSAFTAQFVTDYVPANYKDSAIIFETTPVKGTSVLMIDWTDPDNLAYYLYLSDGSSKSVNLSSFKHIYDKTAYVAPENKTKITETLLFVVEFPYEGEQNKTNTLQLTRQLKAGTYQTQHKKLSFSTVNKRTFSLNANVQKAKFEEDININYTSQCQVSDSRFAGRSLSLVIVPEDISLLTPDINVRANDVRYPLTTEGKFIVPLKSAHDGGGTVTLAFLSNLIEEAEFTVELWASDTDDANRPMMGDKVAELGPIVISGNTKPSFKVTGMSDRLLHYDELQQVVTVTFQERNADNITVELQKKNGTEYITQTDIMSSVNGNATADASPGVFTINSTGVVSIKLSDSATEGTYRLLFTATKGENTIKVPYNFILLQ